MQAGPPLFRVYALRLCFSLKINNYKFYRLSLWAWLSGHPPSPHPQLHGCKMLIICLELMMSLCWNYLRLWTKTCRIWDRRGWACPRILVWTTISHQICTCRSAWKQMLDLQMRHFLSSDFMPLCTKLARISCIRISCTCIRCTRIRITCIWHQAVVQQSFK